VHPTGSIDVKERFYVLFILVTVYMLNVFFLIYQHLKMSYLEL